MTWIPLKYFINGISRMPSSKMASLFLVCQRSSKPNVSGVLVSCITNNCCCFTWVAPKALIAVLMASSVISSFLKNSYVALVSYHRSLCYGMLPPGCLTMFSMIRVNLSPLRLSPKSSVGKSLTVILCIMLSKFPFFH
jgi:hypothetical protein